MLFLCEIFHFQYPVELVNRSDMAGVCCVRKCQAILKIDFRNFGLKTFVAAQQNRNVSELNNFFIETVTFVVNVFIEKFYLKFWVVSKYIIIVLTGGLRFCVFSLCIFILLYTKLGR